MLVVPANERRVACADRYGVWAMGEKTLILTIATFDVLIWTYNTLMIYRALL